MDTLNLLLDGFAGALTLENLLYAAVDPRIRYSR